MTIISLPRRRELEQVVRGLRVRTRKAARYSWAVVLGASMASVLVLTTISSAAPSLAELIPVMPAPHPLAQSTRIFDVRGRLIATLHGDQNRMVVADFPSILKNAVIAIEDQHFYQHNGVELSSIARAFLANTKAGGVSQGGSTITQQFIRNAYPEVGTARTLTRKAREALLAMRYEQLHDKRDILIGYLNTVYFGNGAYGAEAASRTYFGTKAKDLSVAQAAFLAGAIQAPEVYAFNRKAALARRNQVIARMASIGSISAKTAAVARRTPLSFRNAAPTEQAAYFVEYVRRLLLTSKASGGFGLTDDDILTGGLNVFTTLDLDLQRAAEQAVRAVLPYRSDPEAALVSMTTDGEIRALIGGRNFTSVARARGFNMATQIAPGGGRQAGSAFKPFTLAAYLRKGFSVYKTFPAPRRVTVKACPNGDGSWSPENYDGESFGRLDVMHATYKSVNTVYAQVVALAGPENAVRAARDAGITSDLSPVCSIALGVFGVTPLEVARAYATFAARGIRPDPIAVTKVTDADGTVVAERHVRTKRTIEQDIADQVNSVLAGVVREGTGRPAAIARPSAGKTGTTESHRDVWYAGYTPAPGLSTAVWIGYPPVHGQIKPMLNLHGQPATGGGFSGAIWKRYMTLAVKGMTVRSFPSVTFTGTKSGSVAVSGASRHATSYTTSPTTTATTAPRHRRPKPRSTTSTTTTSSPTPAPAPTSSPSPKSSPSPSPSPSP